RRDRATPVCARLVIGPAKGGTRWLNPGYDCYGLYIRGDAMSKSVKFTLDGREVEARADETIWQVAQRHGTDIPHLCYSPEPGYRADGNCRACMVEIEGERVLAASCIRKPANGMKVTTGSDRARTARKM